ncbi:multifunctional CCA tRNA nucleotidyl transferase/2'3'-cyclic phosphodiesterase/2'nucleotidase/phosphatase [Variovorax sp. J22R133]|uniref:multifunctional CCA tRNA nucleotidyl transferase/2'3'-cyclic phosphodiesterase/2'nucleotidase/phosphatase n=1 Tax=Variovorax brevis TaxID=3053503 RepID=UPI002575D47F|nr:multifunctional CCA tRNA nucleotidyl transferase/2'3'-cyclic phosphodiesterase/2'nucleotidase/phosphatase [Variovorax sp. J22R133]MDM0115111.1 multifunctional CCA tRNA nucleotidyl transferase/2'3'-cyclic phosphodiesterase/2'nucleotidase/phosphatase [Variovorax sp. J22R133]
MQTFLVGGAVRDRLLGLSGMDRDWVVVGATPQEMISQGFLPVGRDFPVFLHPQTHEEYALARTERKSAPGYRGFTIHAAPDVTLEQDLSRRDLTINSIALPEALATALGDGAFKSEDLIDPFHGRRDIQNKVLRHVTDAFREDPVRILRVARFAARFTDFSVAAETRNLMREIVKDGEIDALVAERVWQELSRGLMEAQPSRMFDVLVDCGALGVMLPEIDADTALMQVIDMAAHMGTSLAVRFACLVHRLHTKPLHALCERWRVPVEVRELAEVVSREHGHIDRSGDFEASELMRLLERCDAIRKPERFDETLLACACIARAASKDASSHYPPRERLQAALRAAQDVATEPIALAAQQSGAKGPEIGAAIHRARTAAVLHALSSTRP